MKGHERMRYVAFLRAINIANRRIKMADLRALYEDLGYSGVATYIASGNVIFEAHSPPLASGLECAFSERFGFTSEVFLRSSEDVSSIVEAVPWTGVDDVVEVSFLECESEFGRARALKATAVAPEQLVVAGREIFFLRGRGRGVPTTHKESTSMNLLDMKMTRRGMSTVDQIHARFLLPRM
jgi:uncharacterized protein (DUF1697 family)